MKTKRTVTDTVLAANRRSATKSKVFLSLPRIAILHGRGLFTQFGENFLRGFNDAIYCSQRWLNLARFLPNEPTNSREISWGP